MSTIPSPAAVSLDALSIDAEVSAAVAAAISFAAIAPPLYGTRQWRYEIHDFGVIDLRADPHGCLSDREVTIACGTALLDLRAALEHTGLDLAVSARPDPYDHRLLARIHSLGVGDPPRSDLFASIACRHANRERFQGRPVTSHTLHALQAAAAAEGAWLHEFPRPFVTEEAPLAAVLTTAGDGPMAWLAAGQALERVVLTAVSDGLQASIGDRPVVGRKLRDRLAAVLEPPGVAQIELRFGYPLGVAP